MQHLEGSGTPVAWFLKVKKQILPMYTACNKHFTPTHLCVNVHTCTEFTINAVISINFILHL